MNNLFWNRPRQYKRGLSIRLLAACCLMFVLSSSVLPIRTVFGQCDAITFHDTSAFNCYRFEIDDNGNSDPIEFIQITINGPVGRWICSTSLDPPSPAVSPMTNSTWSHITQPAITGLPPATPYDYWVGDNTFGANPILNGNSGYIKICFCCIGNQQDFDIPITITTYHMSNATTTTQTCSNTIHVPLHPCGDSWSCNADCDGLSLSGPTKGPDNRWHFCATVTQSSKGDLGQFSLNFSCNNGSGPLLNWDIESAPDGWSTDNVGSSGASFTDTGNVSIPNCSSGTFCFVSDDCGGNSSYCNSMTVSLSTAWQNPLCSVSQTLTFPNPLKDNGCCQGQKTAGVTKPTQDQSTGVWTTCVDVKVAGNRAVDTLSNIKICRTLGRCTSLASVAPGWVLDHSGYSAPDSCDYFKRTTAPNSGCRTFQFCYETTCCHDAQEIVTFDISDLDNGTVSIGSVNDTIPRDSGTCCDGVWHKKDYVTVSWDPNYPNCLTYTLHNTHWECSPLNDFHFSLPDCSVIGVTVTPSGFTPTVSGGIVDIVPSTGSTATIPCCSTMVVQVCFDCVGPFSYSCFWTSTYNGTVISTGTQTAPGIHDRLSVPDRGQVTPSEPNFPNPFGAPDFKTTIPFVTNGTGVAEIEVSNASGKLVLKDEMEVGDAGKHFFYFTGKELPSGTYFYRIQFPKGKRIIVNRTMILVK